MNDLQAVITVDGNFDKKGNRSEPYKEVEVWYGEGTYKKTWRCEETGGQCS